MGTRLVSRGKATGVVLAGFGIAPLQWGRDLLVAESAHRYFAHRFHNRLQWGRDLLVAESVAPRGSFSRLPGFNGAATC